MSFTRTLRAVGGAVVAGALLFGSAPVASADSIRDSQWPLQAFGAEKVWSESTGKGVTVAVIDTGVNGLHPDLVGNVLAGKIFEKSTGRADRETTADHGTAMASIIAGHGHGSDDSEGVKGLAPDAKILPLKLDNELNAEGKAPDYAEAIRYAVDHGASIINMSFADYGTSNDEDEAIAYAAAHDVIMVAGVGNAGTDNTVYPAAAPGVVAVGAIHPDGVIWDHSQTGSNTMLTAPGVDIRSASADGGYHTADGTSDATAYVSGAAAILRAKFPDLTAGQIVNRLVKTAGLPASENGLSLPDKAYGYGFIRPYKALTDDIPAGSEQGPLKTPTKASSAPSTAASTGGSGDGNSSSASSDSSGLSLAVVIGIGAAVLVVVIVLIVVLSKRGNRRNGPPPGGPGGWGGPGGPGGQPYPPQQAGPPTGYAPPQQQNPYASQQQPPNQWPNQ